MMSLSRTILGLLFLATSAMVTGGAAQPLGASGSGSAPSPVVEEPPVFCLLEKNHGACVTCCMEATDAPASACSRFCKNVVPPIGPPPPGP